MSDCESLKKNPKKTVQSRNKQQKTYKSITTDKTEYIMKTLKNNTCVKRGLETLQTTDVRAFLLLLLP